MPRIFRALALSLLAPLVIAGCDVGSTTNGIDTSNGFGASVILSPTGAASLSAPVGGSNTAAVRITRVGTFTGAVNLAAEQVPSTVIITFNPAVIPAGENSSIITMTVPANIPAGTSAFRLHATGSPNFDLSITVPLAFTN